MPKSFLANKNFQEFINKLKINEEQKNALISKIPMMDKGERMEFLDILKNIYLLNSEEEKAIEKIKKNWEEPEQQN